MAGRTWALAAVAGAISMTLIGGAARATFQASVVDQADLGQPAPLALPDQLASRDRIKVTLDALVKKGTITQSQEDAILQALRDATPSPQPASPRPGGPNIRAFIGDLARSASAYLGLTETELATQLRSGKSVADIANGTPGKSSGELIRRLTTTATDRVDRAVAAKRLTAEQAAALKPKLAAEIFAFAQRSGTPQQAPRPRHAPQPTPSATP